MKDIVGVLSIVVCFLVVILATRKTRNYSVYVRKELLSSSRDSNGRPVFVYRANSDKEVAEDLSGWTYPASTWHISRTGKNEYTVKAI